MGDVLRDAGPHDLPAIVAIYNASIPAGTATADTVPISVESRHAWFAQFNPERRPLWVLERDGVIIAWIGLTSFYAGRPAYNATAEVSLYVDPAYQRTGIGRRLKTEMIAACPRFGVTTLLSFHFDHNPGTARLNRELGFVPAGHLERIAIVNGQERGLIISLLRIPAPA